MANYLPKRQLRSLFKRDRLLSAINYRARRHEPGEGLCTTFSDIGIIAGSFLPDLLATMGAKEGRERGSRDASCYYWPPAWRFGYSDAERRRAEAQRLMFLAFLLTWYDWEVETGQQILPGYI